MELIVWTVDVQMHLYVLFPHLRLTMSSKMSFNFSVDGESKLSASWSELHPTSMGFCIGPLRWLILFAGSLHRMGCPDLCTSICCGRARPYVSPLDGWRWPVEEPTTAIDLLPLLPRHWSILLSRCGLALNHPPPSFTSHPHFKMHLEYFHPHSILSTTTPIRKPARSCAACVGE